MTEANNLFILLQRTTVRVCTFELNGVVEFSFPEPHVPIKGRLNEKVG